MHDHLRRAEALVANLQSLSKQQGSRSGDEIATDQLAVFGELLVVLARHLDDAQQTVRRLTWALTALTILLVVLTIVLVAEAISRFIH